MSVMAIYRQLTCSVLNLSRADYQQMGLVGH